MTEIFARILQGYGTELTIEGGAEDVTCRAFLQPVRSAGTHETKQTPLGRVLPGEAVYIGPPDVSIEGCTVLRGTERWRVRRTEQILVGDETVYLWGALTREGEVDSFAGT